MYAQINFVKLENIQKNYLFVTENGCMGFPVMYGLFLQLCKQDVKDNISYTYILYTVLQFLLFKMITVTLVCKSQMSQREQKKAIFTIEISCKVCIIMTNKRLY